MLLISSALLALSALLHHEADRTAAVRGRTQLRQMLTAGAAVARRRIEQGLPGADANEPAESDPDAATVSQRVKLPGPLADRSGELSLEFKHRGGGDSAAAWGVRVEARLADRAAHQTVRFVETGSGGWRAAEARLNGELAE